MRLIDADALKVELEELQPLNWTETEAEAQEVFDFEVFNNLIDNAPTIDAVPREDYISMERTVARLQQGIADAPTIDACPYYHHEPTGEPFCEKDDRRHGEWLELNDPDATLENYYVCNQCGRMSNYNSNFCPNCGADMRGENE